VSIVQSNRTCGQGLTFVSEKFSRDHINTVIFHTKRGVCGCECVAGGQLREDAADEACCRNDQGNHFA